MTRKPKARHNIQRNPVLEHAADTAKSIMDATIMIVFLLGVAALAINYG